MHPPFTKPAQTTIHNLDMFLRNYDDFLEMIILFWAEKIVKLPIYKVTCSQFLKNAYHLLIFIYKMIFFYS